MKILRIDMSSVAGGCNFVAMVNSIFRQNGIEDVKLYKNWKNDKTVFEIPTGERYVIGDRSYIFNYDGVLELEPFDGAVREIKEDNNIRSSFATEYSLDTLIFGEY